MSQSMNINFIDDFKSLPSILDTHEVNQLLEHLVFIIRRDGIPPVVGAETINNLLFSREFTLEPISIETTKVVLGWIRETYDRDDHELIDWHSANVVNLDRAEAISFFKEKLSTKISKYEKHEFIECLLELGVKI